MSEVPPSGYKVPKKQKEYTLWQNQKRGPLDRAIAVHVEDGWELTGPVQFQVFPQLNTVYYLATFERMKNSSPVSLRETHAKIAELAKKMPMIKESKV